MRSHVLGRSWIYEPGMRMAHKLHDLRALSDDELVAAHDRLADNTFVGIDYYLDELKRRELSRQAKASYRLSVVSGVLAAVASMRPSSHC
jgi:hypothetical protein